MFIINKKELPQEPLIDEFCNYLRRKSLAQNSITAYSFSICLYFSHYSELTIENLRNYRTFLIQEFLPATANQRIHAMNHFLRFLEDRNQTRYPELHGFRMIALKLPRDSFQDSVISNEDCQILQDHLKEDHQDFWYFIVRFLVTTGVRVSELTQIKVEHLTCGFLDMYSKGGKIRRIYITDTLCHEALEWCASRGKSSGFLFSTKNGRPVTARGIQYQLKHFARQYGLNPDTIYPHSFRHRFAKNFLLRCGDIALLADLMGHESIETTRIYLTRSSKEQQLLLDDIVTW